MIKADIWFSVRNTGYFDDLFKDVEQDVWDDVWIEVWSVIRKGLVTHIHSELYHNLSFRRGGF